MIKINIIFFLLFSSTFGAVILELKLTQYEDNSLHIDGIPQNPIKNISSASTPVCRKYKFKTTPNHGSFSEARTMCKTLGGDLLYKNLGPNGAQYHAILRNLIEDHSAHYWIGMTDIEDDGKYHLLDGDAYDASDMTQQALYYWYPGQPNLDGHCVFIWSYPTQAYGLADFPCQNNVYDNKPVKGICEICES